METTEPSAGQTTSGEPTQLDGGSDAPGASNAANNNNSNSIAALASEHVPKAVATTPSGLRLGGRPLVQTYHVTALDAIFGDAEKAGEVVTIEKIFGETELDDLLWEARSKNAQLLAVLNKEEELNKLLKFAANNGEPFLPIAMRQNSSQEDLPAMETHIKNVQYSCEILALEGTHRAIFDSANFDRVMAFLFSLPEGKGKKGELPAHLSAIAQVFVVQLPEVTTSYLLQCNAQDGLMKDLLGQLENAAAIDLLLAVIGLASPSPAKAKPKEPPTEQRVAAAQQFNEWLTEADFIKKTIALLTDEHADTEAATHAADLLKELIEVATRHLPRNLPPPPVFTQLIQEENLAVLIPGILELKSESVFSAGVAVILELLKYEGMTSKPKEGEEASPSKAMSPLLRFIRENIAKLVEKLQTAPPAQVTPKPRRISIGQRGAPAPVAKKPEEGEFPKRFGFLRLRVLGFCGRLLAHCIGTPNDAHTEILDTLSKLNFWTIVLELFFEFPQNNFAHNVIERLVGVAMTAPEQFTYIKVHILSECGLIDRIIAADLGNQADCAAPNGARRGYMGALTNMSTTLIKAAEKDETVKKLLDESEDWQKYSTTSLAQIKEIQETETSTFPLPGASGGKGRGRGRGRPAPGGASGADAGAAPGAGRGRGEPGARGRGGLAGRGRGEPGRGRGQRGSFPEVEILVPAPRES